eukprot:Colp12_sorted_trinity150504_noHs@2393
MVFHGCYLITSLKPSCKLHTYIGYTVDPNKRIRQHNGELTMGAKQTSKKRPWEIVLVVHGFPDEKTALRFEWAWQHPHESRHLKHLYATSAYGLKDTRLGPRVKLVFQMLNTSPWRKHPLTLQWVNRDYMSYGDGCLPLPTHMPLKYGPVRVDNKLEQEVAEEEHVVGAECIVCQEELAQEDYFHCSTSRCSMVGHIICLAEWFLNQSSTDLLPVQGSCPLCRCDLLWGVLVQRWKVRIGMMNNRCKPRKKQDKEETVVPK